MHPFTFIKAGDNATAIKASKENAGSKYIAGGTNLVDLIKMNIEKPARLINITDLDLKKLRNCPMGNRGWCIGHE